MVTVLSALEGVKVLQGPAAADYEMPCEFELNGRRFKISEAYGDNSCFDAASFAPNVNELDVLAKHFERSDPRVLAALWETRSIQYGFLRRLRW